MPTTPQSFQKRAVWLILLAASSTFALTMGMRQNMGLFLSDINTTTGLGIGNISLAFAFGQLWWGLTQPFAGAMADRYGSDRVLLVGILLIAIGTFFIPSVDSTAGLIFTIGVLASGGAGMAGPAVLMATATRMTPPEKHGLANGMVSAGGSIGQFIIAPVAGILIATVGWANALQILGLVMLLGLPATFILCGKAPQGAGARPARLPNRVVIAKAFSTPGYLMLTIGFFACGFHIAFLATHLPGVILSCGLPPQYGAWSLAVLGLFNIAGALGMGWALGRWRMKSLLSMVYTVRALAVLAFLFAPKNGPVVLAFAAVMGMTYLATIPPTAGLVAKFFGPANMAMLFGIVMCIHQVGGFLGAWLGGRVFGATGSYDWMWYIDIVLALGAALIHFPIKEPVLAPPAQVTYD